MHFFKTSIVVLAMGCALAGCGAAKSSSSDVSSQSGGAAIEQIPTYPGAVTRVAGSGSNMGTTAAGKVMQTTDSFDKVYGWYQRNLPAGAERAHADSPVPTAVFTIGEATGQGSVTLTTQGGETMITIAHVKT